MISMLKKTALSEKLRRLKTEEPAEVKEEEKAVQTKTLVKTAPAEPESISPDEKLPKEPQPILKVKKVEEIDEKKPETFIEPLISDKKDIKYINELVIPEEKLSKLFKIQTSYTENTLTQMLTAWKDPEKVLKWTVKHDKHGEEFYSLKDEGLQKMKDNPPIYGMEFDDGAIIASHMGEYTFTMGCYNFDIKSLVKVFAFGLENAKKFNL